MHGLGNQEVDFFDDLLILALFIFKNLKGKRFFNNGDKYEGEFKDDKKHG